ncbi:uncharacterized protein LY79DRAFT_543688 [Colletotrichum navitas]|uniref:Uncharacterized protein n=1 Tax=Colletotrichum navitas TaxID=681940 RepID=A0AAD8Q6G4_9PEZI|nr:uncharacterized protein LY79DRAFT_543688 [Colletotrichum navitas]KAK1596605.1 hypothetical protein LY79DRAFT_543688 [Colletotrichum navitas]
MPPPIMNLPALHAVLLRYTFSSLCPVNQDELPDVALVHPGHVRDTAARWHSTFPRSGLLLLSPPHSSLPGQLQPTLGAGGGPDFRP